MSPVRQAETTKNPTESKIEIIEENNQIVFSSETKVSAKNSFDKTSRDRSPVKNKSFKRIFQGNDFTDTMNWCATYFEVNVKQNIVKDFDELRLKLYEIFKLEVPNMSDEKFSLTPKDSVVFIETLKLIDEEAPEKNFLGTYTNLQKKVNNFADHIETRGHKIQDATKKAKELFDIDARIKTTTDQYYKEYSELEAKKNNYKLSESEKAAAMNYWATRSKTIPISDDAKPEVVKKEIDYWKIHNKQEEWTNYHRTSLKSFLYAREKCLLNEEEFDFADAFDIFWNSTIPPLVEDSEQCKNYLSDKLSKLKFFQQLLETRIQIKNMSVIFGEELKQSEENLKAQLEIEEKLVTKPEYLSPYPIDKSLTPILQVKQIFVDYRKEWFHPNRHHLDVAKKIEDKMELFSRKDLSAQEKLQLASNYIDRTKRILFFLKKIELPKDAPTFFSSSISSLWKRMNTSLNNILKNALTAEVANNQSKENSLNVQQRK